VAAQADSTGKAINIKAGMFYNSNLNYYGRTDSLRSTGFFPLAELWISGKYYVNAAPVFTHNNMQGMAYAGTVVTAGYLNNNGKTTTHVYAVKPIYKDNSVLVQSALKGQVASNFSWLNKILNVTVGGDVKFSDGVDFGTNLGLDHIVRTRLPGDVVLVIDPSAYLYAGTQRFIQSREKSGLFPLPGTTTEAGDEGKRFNVLSYEFSAPVILVKGKWMWLVTPAYVIPQNLVTIAGRPDLSEKGQAMFYLTAGIRFSF
jgi:hypothetical protein